QQAYDFPVDVEFTANFSDGGAYKINVVQCRPLQIRGGARSSIRRPACRPSASSSTPTAPSSAKAACATSSG
ncbi:MAG TPA: hypothetical protein PK082_06785, partial [Phycisphaerae bacterium]|nr:hypothetical protein [Phycisphaerae bacterium]